MMGHGFDGHGARRAARCIEALITTEGKNMLEFFEIVRHGLPLTEPRSWLFIATVIAAGVAGWKSLSVVEHFAKNKEE